MPQRRPRRAPPTSRLTTAGRLAIVALLAGLVVLRTGWGRVGRDGDGIWPLQQRVVAPGGPTPGGDDALPGAAATVAGDPVDGTVGTDGTDGPVDTAVGGDGGGDGSGDGDAVGGNGDDGGDDRARTDASDRNVSSVRLGGLVAEGWLHRDAALGLDVPTVVLRAAGRPVRAVAWSRLDPTAGRDVTGDGRPDLVVARDTGGNGCCWSLWVFEAVVAGSTDGGGTGPAGPRPGDDATPSVAAVTGDTAAALAAAGDALSDADAAELGLRAALRLPPSRCRGRFEDVDGDGVPEVVTCDPTVPTALCSATDAADPPVVLRYDDAARSFAPATPRLAARLADAGDGAESVASIAAAGDDLCSALPAALAALYAGRADDAWARLAGVDDAAGVRRRIAALVAASPLYVTADGDGRPVVAEDPDR